jgi:ABC-type multidrug transport system ATPase subunit
MTFGETETTDGDETVLRLADVHHSYDARPVLVAVSLEVRAGECVALLGANGSGKSTLLRLAAGRERPGGGSVEFRGARADEDRPGFRAGVAAVLEAGAHYPDLTVREHLILVALAHGLGPAAGEAADRSLAAHRLTDRARALPSALSSGQSQLMALAAADIRPYALLLLDEPEQRLDSHARAELARWVRRAARRPAGILLATHDPRLAADVADRTYTLADGRLHAAPDGADS